MFSKNRMFLMFNAALVVVLTVALVAAMATGKKNEVPENSIIKTLDGHELVYYSIAGKPMTYTITESDITSIEKTAYKGNPAWKVSVGTGLNWDIIMDESGTTILETHQNFVT